MLLTFINLLSYARIEFFLYLYNIIKTFLFKVSAWTGFTSFIWA